MEDDRLWKYEIARFVSRLTKFCDNDTNLFIKALMSVIVP